MSLFANQPMICCICGKEFNFGFNYHGVPTCSNHCWDEYKWRRVLFIMGEEYYSQIKEKSND